MKENGKENVDLGKDDFAITFKCIAIDRSDVTKWRFYEEVSQKEIFTRIWEIKHITFSFLAGSELYSPLM